MADETIVAESGSAWHAPRSMCAFCLIRLVRPYLHLDSRDPWRGARHLWQAALYARLTEAMCMRSTIGGSRLERIPVQSLASSTYSANCQTLRHAESTSFVLNASGTANSSRILASSKSKDMEVQRGGRWANRKHFKCETQNRSGLKACARDECAGRCDVNKRERSPQTLPRSKVSQKFDTRTRTGTERPFST